MKTKILLAAFLAVLVIPVIASASDYSIFCGQSQNITCEHAGENHTVTSSAQNVCKINRTLAANESYDFLEGPCDISFKCSIPYVDQGEGIVNFPMKLRIESMENLTNVNLTIRDWLGNEFKSRGWDVNYGDTGYQEWNVDFKCPSEINTDINVETCAKFFDQILQTGDPLLFQLASGQTTCIEELVNCQGDVKAVNSQYSEYKVNYQQRVDERIVAEANLINCRNELDPNHPNSTVRQYIDQRDVKVDKYWQWLSWGLIAVLVILLASYLIVKAW